MFGMLGYCSGMCRVNYEIGEFYMTNTSFNNKTNNQTVTNIFMNENKLIFCLWLLSFKNEFV